MTTKTSLEIAIEMVLADEDAAPDLAAWLDLVRDGSPDAAHCEWHPRDVAREWDVSLEIAHAACDQYAQVVASRAADDLANL